MTRVEGTNDYSIVSKLSAAKMGYFEDEFLEEFVSKPRARAPLINHGYYIRNKSLELTFERAVEYYSKKDEPFQVLSIGAGFDTTYFNMNLKFKPQNMTFFEIDLPSNVTRKCQLIKTSEKCCPQTGLNSQFIISLSLDENSLISENYKLFACDLSDSETLRKCLDKYGFGFHVPTLVLSECVITYMSEKDSTSLVAFLSENLENAAFFVYEQCRPSDGFGAFMVKHFDKIESPIHGIRRFKSTEDQIDRYLTAGWEKCKVYTLAEVYFNLSPEEKSRLNKIEMFDEFEEFILKSSHYFVLVATKGTCNLVHGTGSVRQLTQPDLTHADIELSVQVLQSNQSFLRFGHSFCSTPNGLYMVGGFGVQDKNHKRIGSLIRFSLEEGKIVGLKEFKDKKFERMYCGLVDWKGKLLMLGGRLSPNCALQGLVEVDLETGECSSSDLPASESRWRHQTIVYGDYLVVVGGRDTEKVYSDVYAMNLYTGEKLVAQLDYPILSCSLAVWGEKIIVSGGNLNLAEIQESLFILQIKEDRITVKRVGLALEPRIGHTSHVLNNYLILVGGVGIRNSPGLDVVDLISGDIYRSFLPSFLPGEKGEPSPDILMLHNHSSFVQEEKIIIVGGGGNCFSFGTHINDIWEINLRNSFPFIFES